MPSGRTTTPRSSMTTNNLYNTYQIMEKSRLICVEGKVYDRVRMSENGLDEAQVRHLYAIVTGRPDAVPLSEEDRDGLMGMGLIDEAGECSLETMELMEKCEAEVSCAACRCYRNDADGERCTVYGNIADPGEYCRDWEERL